MSIEQGDHGVQFCNIWILGSSCETLHGIRMPKPSGACGEAIRKDPLDWKLEKNLDGIFTRVQWSPNECMAITIGNIVMCILAYRLTYEKINRSHRNKILNIVSVGPLNAHQTKSSANDCILSIFTKKIFWMTKVTRR